METSAIRPKERRNPGLNLNLQVAHVIEIRKSLQLHPPILPSVL